MHTRAYLKVTLVACTNYALTCFSQLMQLRLTLWSHSCTILRGHSHFIQIEWVQVGDLEGSLVGLKVLLLRAIIGHYVNSHQILEDDSILLVQGEGLPGQCDGVVG